jgi:motility quorum-sensing regulator / GCU-specific mRNA interferase toxin
MTEKRIAHYALTRVKELIKEGKVFSTKTALETAAALEFSFEDMLIVILELDVSDLYKSMTTHADHTIWQDVYHFPAEGDIDIYLKLTVSENVLIVSFKEL